MVDRVVVHIGLPKTGTTYLQSIFWGAREELAAQGVVLPGDAHREHLWASRTVREDPRNHERSKQHRTAWSRMLTRLRQEPGTGLISHEGLAAASAEQARTMVEQLPTDDVHVVVTAREPLGLFTASWQENVKNGATTPLTDYAREVSDSSTDLWNWRTLDLRLVLERWSQAVPPERIHVLVLEPGAPRDDVWRKFAAVLGIDPGSIPVAKTSANASLGVAEVETLRRINAHLTGTWTSHDRGTLIRRYLAERRLVPRGGDRFWPADDQVGECRRRGEEAVAHLASRPYDVAGDPEHLRVPADLPDRRRPDSVDDTEVAAVATELAAAMLADVRELRGRPKQAGRRGRSGPGADAGAGVSAPRRVARRVLHRLPDRRRRQVVRLARRLRRG